MDRPFYIDQIRPFVGKNIVKVFTGIRRCGKSCIMNMVRDLLNSSGVPENQIIEANFESKKIEFVKTVDLVFAHVKKRQEAIDGKLYLLFDEVQELAGWEKLVNSLLVDFDVDVYLTGSNAKLLSGELSTYLGGRYVEIHVFPLSFAEVVDWQPEIQSGVAHDLFRRFIKDGGMPFVYDAKIHGAPAMAYLSDVFGSVVVKDIAKRHKIRDIDLLERFLSYLVSEIGHTFSAASVKKYLKHENRNISLETLYNYLRYAEEACLILPLKRNDVVGKRLLSSQEKIYIADHGFREALFGNNESSVDQVLENIVAVELVRKGYSVSVGMVGAKEVDFVAEKGNSKLYVQVAYLMPTEETRAREFSALERIPDNYPKYVLSMDEMDFSRNGIRHCHIEEFLLSSDI